MADAAATTNRKRANLMVGVLSTNALRDQWIQTKSCDRERLQTSELKRGKNCRERFHGMGVQ